MVNRGKKGHSLDMKESEIERIEISLLLEAIYQRYGYDFRSYSRASIDRRVRKFLSSSGLATIFELIDRIIHDEPFFAKLLQSFSITVSEMFRDPFVYQALRKNVMPVLHTFPSLRLWHAGCATGEEVYSLAILLKEENLYDKSTIYATDFNDTALKAASNGIFPADRIREFTQNYQKAGGMQSFTDYYRARYDNAVMNGGLKERITFANHNLASDHVFVEAHLICCRNVLIYFDRPLQNRVLTLFADSLVRGGFLCLGTKEDLGFSNVADRFRAVDKKARIYKKTLE